MFILVAYRCPLAGRTPSLLVADARRSAVCRRPVPPLTGKPSLAARQLMICRHSCSPAYHSPPLTSRLSATTRRPVVHRRSPLSPPLVGCLPLLLPSYSMLSPLADHPPPLTGRWKQKLYRVIKHYFFAQKFV